MKRTTETAAWLIVLYGCAVCAAQVPATSQNAAPQPASQPAAQPGEILSEVIEVHGDVRHASLTDNTWKPVQLGDKFPPRTRLLTGIRASVKLRIGDEEPYTCLLIEQVGLTVLSEAFTTDDTKRVRIGVGFGRIRAGVAEGGLQSEFTVDSPVATLSKRGTWGLWLFYERATDQFAIGLVNSGLLEAINKQTGKSRRVRPHEHVNNAMRLWLDQSELTRNVAVADILGQSDIEIAFNRVRQDGLGVLNPGQGRAALIQLPNGTARGLFADLLSSTLGGLPPPGTTPPEISRLRVEGFFGTGRGDELLEVLIESSNPLAAKGFARPGRYKFRRAALESWLAGHRKR